MASTIAAGLGRRVLRSPLLGALTTPHPVDRYLELVRPAWSLQDLRAEVVAVRRTTPDSVTLTLRPNANWQGFEAGQHLRLSVEIDGVRRTRFYSPACSAHGPAGLLEITVKRHADGEVSNYLWERARVGMVFGLSQAEGDFVLPEARPEQLVLISGGSGITPVMSMLRTLCDERYDGLVTFLHYSRTPADTIYRDELAEIAARELNVRLILVHTRRGDGELSGHFSREHLQVAAPDFATADAFVCGPPNLIDTARALWTEERLEQRLRVEHFVPPAPSVVLGEAKGEVRFARSGLQAANDGNTLLDQAEAAGLEPESGCRMGICHSCVCRKVSGSVRNARTGEISTEDDEQIQICISVPVGDVELEL